MDTVKILVALLISASLLMSCGRETKEDDGVSLKEVVATSVILNAIAGTVQKVIGEKSEGLGPVILAHATPKGVEPFALEKCLERSSTFNKVLKSTLGFSLVTVKYKISFLYGCRYQGKGHYLANIAFTPLEVETDPLYNVRAASVSEAAINKGTAKAPIASVKFVVTFTVSGIGSKTVTDEFSLNAKDGELTAVLGEF